MPRVRALTEAARRAEEKERKNAARLDFVRTELRCSAMRAGYRNMKEVAEAMGVNYATLAAWVRKGDMTLQQFAALAEFLRLDAATAAACCGVRS